jgi:NhaP-type Na+/H+ or K+/H+ antiporter
MNEVILGTVFGILLGPYVLNIVDPRSWTTETDILTREFMRVVLVIGLFAIGVDLPRKYLGHHLKSMLIMVVPTMAFGWFVLAGTWASALTGSHTSLTTFSLLQSLHPRTCPETRLCILARHLSMLDSHGPNCQRGRNKSVS